MRRNKVEVYLHLLWGTWDRLPLIEPAWERRLYRVLAHGAQKLKCEVIVVNGVADHVHLVLKLPTTVAIATLVQQLKGTSSHFINETIQPDYEFRWQGFYAAFSVSPNQLPHVVNYVKRQKEHHEQQNPVSSWEDEYLQPPSHDGDASA